MNEKKPESRGKTCTCPYCDNTMGEEEPFPFCRICGKKVECCPECGEPMKSGEKTCPSCGSEVPYGDFG